MPSRDRVLITDRPWPNLDIETEILSTSDIELIDAPDGSEETLVRLADGVDAIATCWARVSDAVLAAAPNCRLVARMGIELDNIDVASATRRGMLVTNVPDYCIEEVSDHAVALLLACARNIAYFHRQTKRGEYDLAHAPPMRRLTTQTLGLFGLGRIGQRTAEKASGLGLRVIAHTASGNDHGTGIPMVRWDELLSDSDYLSLHAPLTDATRSIIDGEALSRMKPTAFLINTSRGGLVDERALWESLRENRLAGAALDVFDPEPPNLSHPLFQDPRVIVTPHAAFVSEEAVAELRSRVAVQIRTVLAGGIPANLVNR
ncbi:MAG: C-terminal binding protein [Planctomycetaceae bacterium]|nr:C-terminal binding protein [Planctomycetaceae bacterium]